MCGNMLYCTVMIEKRTDSSYNHSHKKNAKSAWNYLTREFRAVHGLGGDAAQDNFFAEWTKNYGGSYCTNIRYENGQIFEYCFKGKGAKHNPFDGGLVTSKDAYASPYLP